MLLREAHGVSPEQSSTYEHRSTREIDRSWVPTPDAAAARLQSDPEAPCLRLEYLALEKGEVIAIATNYVLDPEASAIGTRPLARTWYELLDDAGVVVFESEFTLGCMVADEQTTSLLSIEPGSAVLVIEQVIRDVGGRPYNFAYIVSRGDRHFVSRARRDPTGGNPL